MSVAHEGLASLGVDLHEVGNLLALTNSLVQLHNLDGGSFPVSFKVATMVFLRWMVAGLGDEMTNDDLMNNGGGD